MNQLIQRPTEERAQQSVLATSLTRSAPVQHQHGSQFAGIIFIVCFMDGFLHQASFVTGNWCYDRHCSVRLVICFDLAIDQIAQSGLSSLKVIYYSAQLFRFASDETHNGAYLDTWAQYGWFDRPYRGQFGERKFLYFKRII